MPPVNLHAHFEFSNCCTNCCVRHVSENKQLYINNRLEIELWNRRKANAESLVRSSSRVDLLIKDKIKEKELGVNQEQALETIKKVSSISCERKPVTKKDLISIIVAINALEELQSSGESIEINFI